MVGWRGGWVDRWCEYSSKWVEICKQRLLLPTKDVEKTSTGRRTDQINS